MAFDIRFLNVTPLIVALDTVLFSRRGATETGVPGSQQNYRPMMAQGDCVEIHYKIFRSRG